MTRLLTDEVRAVENVVAGLVLLDEVGRVHHLRPPPATRG